ncbi:mis18-binding protein 1 [Microcaecilia unicolor]|uniref:Mis18-binding protein 1 n=1 Tax=Microcaecilia unicolor TaxID=1415580 RepID=A0A6P7YUH3_9AMPH|nr:mis18-binding protein 1 [Microcaecilia unicolor]
MLLTPSKNPGFENPPFSHYKMGEFPLHAVPLDLLPSNTLTPIKDLAKYKKSTPIVVEVSLPSSASFKKPRDGKLKATALQSTLVSEGSYPAELSDVSEIKPGSDTRLTPVASFEEREPELCESPSKLINRTKASSLHKTMHQKPFKNTKTLDLVNCGRDILLTPLNNLHERRQGLRSSSKEKEQRLNELSTRQPTIIDILTVPNKCFIPAEQNKVDILCSDFLALKSPTQIFLIMKERAKHRQQQGEGRMLSSAGNQISHGDRSPTKNKYDYVTKSSLNGSSLNLSFTNKIREINRECFVTSTYHNQDSVFAESQDSDADDEMSQTTVTSTTHNGYIPVQTDNLLATGKGSKVIHTNLLIDGSDTLFKKHQIIDVNKKTAKMDPKSSAPAMHPCEILLNSPKIHIPRKQISKEDGKATPSILQTDNALSNSNDQKQICLHSWILKAVSNSGLCVEGKREDANGIYWHSNIIVERLANNLVKSLTGSIYELKGKIDSFTMKQEGFPHLFIKRFSAGFPEDWKIHFDGFLAELTSQKSKEKDMFNKQNFMDPVKSKGKSSAIKLGKPNLTYSINGGELKSLETDTLELKTNKDVGLTTCSKSSRSHEAKTVKTEEKTTRGSNKSRSKNVSYKVDCAERENTTTTTLESSLLESQRSRSGRLIKRPLAYWLGERIFFDMDWGMTVEGATAASETNIEKSQRKNTSLNSSTKSQRNTTGQTSVEKKNKSKEKTSKSSRISKEKIKSTIQKPTRKQLITDTDESEENIKVSRKNLKGKIKIPIKKHCLQKYISDTEECEAKENVICKKTGPVILLTPINSKTKLQKKCMEHNLTYHSLCETITEKSTENSRSENKLDITNSSESDHSEEFERTTQSIKGSLQKSSNLIKSSSEDGQSSDEEYVSLAVKRKLKVSCEQKEQDSKTMLKHLTMQNNKKNSTGNQKMGYFQQTPLKNNLSLSEESDQDSSLEVKDTQRVVRSLNDKFHCDKEDGKRFQIKDLKSRTSSTKKPLQKAKDARSLSTGKTTETEKKRHQRSTDPFVRLTEEESWTVKEMERLKRAVSSLPKHKNSFWLDVAMAVGTRSAEECQQKHMEDQLVKSSKACTTQKKTASKKEEKGEKPVKITAKVGTLKRKQQMREFLDQIPKENHDDIFSTTPFQTKRVKLPVFQGSHEDDVFQIEQTVPTTPSSVIFPLTNTPQCEHISPGMLGSINRNNYDKYMYRLQKTTKSKNVMAWANIKKKSNEINFTTPKSRTTTTLDKRVSDAVVVGNLFSAEEPIPSDEEEDFYFSS